MKQYLILPVFLCISMLGFAQEKFEFGFVAKAGNFTLPEKIVDNQVSYNSGVEFLRHSAGTNLTMGIYNYWFIGRHFGLSAELLYRRTEYKVESFSKYNFTNASGLNQSTTSQNYKASMSNLVLPLGIFFRHKKFSAGIGAGISYPFSDKVAGKFISKQTGMPEFEQIISNNRQAILSNVLNTNLNATVTYYLEPHTSIGIEYTFEPRGENYTYYSKPFFGGEPLIDCFCTASTTFQPNMKSFTIALRHNILGEPE